MTDAKKKLRQLSFTFLILTVGIAAIAQQPPPEKPPANAAGQWTLYTRGEDGQTHTDYLTIQQNGTVLKGHFKGPNQSGSFNGSINEKHIVIKTNTRHPVTIRGRVDGDTFQGTINVMGRQGEFNGRRQGP